MQAETVAKAQFKARALAYLRRVEKTGAPLVVTDHGRPTVEIRRFQGGREDPLERLRGSVVAYESPLAPVMDDEWEALE